MGRPRICLHGVGPEFDQRKWEAGHLMRVGRSPIAEVSLSDSSISRCHAEIQHSDQGWMVRDLGSTNGTFLNGIRVGQVQRKLQERDVIQFGHVVTIVTALDEEVHCDHETPVGNWQVQGIARHSWQEALETMALDITRRSRPGEQLVTLLKAGHYLYEATTFDEMLRLTLQDAVTLLGAQRGTVILPDDMTGKLVAHALVATKPELDEGTAFSRTLAERCVGRGESLLCSDIRNDPELLTANSVTQGAMGSIICGLLRTPRKTLGVLHLDRGIDQDPFTMADLHLADAIAASMSAGVASAQMLQEKQRNVFIQTVIALVQTLELRDNYTSGHNQRVTDFALLLAEELKMSPVERYCLQIAGPLHDIGKIGMDDAILRKEDCLTPEEYEHMKQHSHKGAALLETIPDLASVVPIVRAHHEWWDGAGYPDNLAGEDIPRLSRIISVADAFDVLTSPSPYRTGGSIRDALVQIRSGSATQFDPECAQAFLRLEPRLQELFHPHQTTKTSPDKKTFAPLIAT